MQIFKLSSNGWKIYKELKLEALREDLEAFGNMYEYYAGMSEEDWRETLDNPNNYILVGQKGEDTVGMIDARRSSGKKVSHVSKIMGIYVRKAYREQGRGRELMEALINQFMTNDQIKKIRLKVSASRPAAVNLYKDLGFEIVGTLHGETKIGEKYYDEYLMERFL